MKKIKIVFVSLLLLVACTLTACIPKTMHDGITKMENKGYKVEKLSKDDISELFGGLTLGADAGVACTMDKEEILVFWFDSTNKAKTFESVISLLAIEILEEALEEDFICKRIGKVYYMGTEQACKDFNGIF